MSPSFRKFMLVLGICIISSMACQIFTPEYEAKIFKEATQTAAAKKTTQESTPVLLKTTPEKSLFEGADEKIVFSYAGENQSYHTGLRNRTVFYIDYDSGGVTASEEASFEEPAGTEMTRRGTDSVKFEGTYDAIMKSFSGNFNIYTQGTATGGDENYDNTVTYNMNGILSAQLIDGLWVGSVNGTSTLTQVWPGGEQADQVTTYNIEWTITGIPDN